MLAGGIVDYSVGAAPHTGGFVVVHEENPLKKTQLAYYKLGDGPFYVFYTPFHLPLTFSCLRRSPAPFFIPIPPSPHLRDRRVRSSLSQNER